MHCNMKMFQVMVYAFSTQGIRKYVAEPPVPVLLINPLSAEANSTVGTANISISNAGTGSLTWTAEENEPWFSLSPASGSAPGTLTVTYQSNPGDQRTGKILITAPGAANSPKEITITQAPKAEQHFTPIWTGNPYNRMNFYFVGATLNSIPLSIGDEIAIFDGSKCVGMAIVNQTPSYENILIIKTSQDDGSGKGFTDGHAITFKYWDVSAGQEITLVSPAFKDITTGNPVSAPLFEGMADYGVSLSSGGTNQQTLSLNKGWNIMSSYIVPQNTDMLSVVQPLISNGTLNKVISETGDTIINVFGTWKNTIGNYDPEQGYKIKLNNGSQLTITGASSAPALSNMYASTQSVSIPLTAGWNIVSYPFANSQNALTAVQTLINAGVLEKVIDETGSSILKVFGTWTNRIGNFTAGKGYEIKVNKDAVLILYESGVPAGRTEETREVRTSTSHFTTVWTGNPFNRMNLYIAGVNASVSIGDEIAVYDGSKCVGAAVVESEISYASPLIITCSQDDGTGNGFTDGHAITFKLWDSSAASESTMPAPNYMELETGNPIAAPTFKGSEEYGVTWNPIDYRADINRNGKADLEDAILALRIVSGITVENIHIDADVNNDQRIGIPEAVYALQKTAKLR